MTWEKVEIGNVSKVISGYAFKSKDFQSSGIPVIKIKNIKDENIVLDECDCVDLAMEVPERFHLKSGDILISLTGSHITLPSSVVGRVAKYRHETNSYLNQRAGKFININSKRCFKDFLFYFLLQKGTLTKIANKAQGAANQANISPGDVEGVEINLPPLPTQRRIASILSTYDDLIENNLRRIKLLEEKAILMYKEIVRCEKLEKIKLKEVAILNEESLKANLNIDKLLYVDIASVSTGSINNKTEFDIKEAPGRAKRILKHQDIIWSCVRPNRKSYSFVWEPEENLIASTGFAVITSREIPATFLYQLVTTKEFVNYLENHAKGATYPAVTASDFEEAPIQVASSTIMKEYNDEAYLFFELKHVLQKQNTKLREARDILLPQLMSGEIVV
jgi:type I restriction enzyme, S subunit